MIVITRVFVDDNKYILQPHDRLVILSGPRSDMSISVVDLESEQNERPTSGSPTGRRGSDTRVPPNTEEEEDINFPWMDCLLEGESDELSSINGPNYGKDIQYHCASSVTVGRNSDTGVLSDFSDYEEDTHYTPEMLDGVTDGTNRK